MRVMFGFIQRWFRAPRPKIVTRLTEQQALAITRNAVADDPLRELLAMTLVEQRTTGLVWIVGSATVGYSLQVTIDDASGDVLKVEHLGLR